MPVAVADVFEIGVAHELQCDLNPPLDGATFVGTPAQADLHGAVPDHPHDELDLFGQIAGRTKTGVQIQPGAFSGLQFMVFAVHIRVEIGQASAGNAVQTQAHRYASDGKGQGVLGGKMQIFGQGEVHIGHFTVGTVENRLVATGRTGEHVHPGIEIQGQPDNGRCERNGPDKYQPEEFLLVKGSLHGPCEFPERGLTLVDLQTAVELECVFGVQPQIVAISAQKTQDVGLAGEDGIVFLLQSLDVLGYDFCLFGYFAYGKFFLFPRFL